MRILLLASLAATLLSGASAVATLKPGKAQLLSAGPLAFGPDGVLLAADPVGAAVFALDTADRTAAAGPAIDIKNANEKIASLLGSTPDQILVRDVAVNPLSHNVYFSVSRGKGPDAQPVLLKLDRAGKFSELALDNIGHARVELPNAPAAAKANQRMEAITDLAYVDGRVFVAGLSSEEFASTLRAIPYPFAAVDKGTAVEIFHGAHGRFETNAPVRTFVAYNIDSKPHLLAAYTCTPLVKVPVSDLKAGQKVMGTTIAELGNRNRPLDMIVYQKAGKDFILMNNSSRGVMKLATDKLGDFPGITKQTEGAGVPYETLAEFKGVEQLDLYDATHALMLVRGEGGSLDLKTVALP